MATILLQAAGGVAGGLVGGPFGAMAGRALGALGGAAIDQTLFGTGGRREGPRLGAARILEADEGAGVPRLYGTARIAGQVIWTTRFEEVASTERQGGKGGRGAGTETTSYSYFGNVAIGLCEGPVACVRRIWADGEEMDLSLVNWRLHPGDESQAPDPLIEARQGRGNAPGYRGLAYVVFERLPLDRWGNRIPQISCEVVRPVGALEANLRAVTIIPGASEHGLDPAVVRERVGLGEDRLVNRHVLHGESDWTASIDELTALCPKLTRAALVVGWFATDLRVGRAEVRPGVETAQRDETETWRVGETERDAALLVSRSEGGPAYGGTPSDAGVLRAIADLKARGLRVTLYPFLLMDVPAGNALPDPYGEAMQASYPWRGRMTLDEAPGRPGSSDRTADARAEIARFVGRASPADFRLEAGRVRYTGPGEWSLRRMVLHQAFLARLTGGVDAFVIGSEMVGLTRLRDDGDRFPFVEALIQLARDVKAVLPEATVTYAADWSEYFGFQPSDGSGDVFFNLDPLWAEPAIGAVGIDNYLPLLDWRDGDADGSSPDGAASSLDETALRRNIAAGEWFDWFYADDKDRRAGRRTPITDGLGKPWVFRAKDIRSWWENRHRERRGGRETGGDTAWVPCSKPIWFTELGCPAADRGANRPNVFLDPKSAESALPWFSTGHRDDAAQRAFLDAHLRHWDETAPGFRDRDNPVSPHYGGRMVPIDAIHLWCWDARPYPAFPAAREVWRDGANWERGHWLSGRLGAVSLRELLLALLTDHGVTAVDASGVEGVVGGFLLASPGSARSQIEALLRLGGIEAAQVDGQLRLRTIDRATRIAEIEAVAEDADAPLLERRRTEDRDRPGELVLAFSDPARAYQPGVAEALRGDAERPRQERVQLPLTLDEDAARRLASGLLRRLAGASETASFALSPADLEVVPGDRLRIAGEMGIWSVERIEDGLMRRIEARRIGFTPALSDGSGREPPAAPVTAAPVFPSRPLATFLDLPPLGLLADGEGPRVALAARPFVPLEVLVSRGGGDMRPRARVMQPAVMGRLAAPLPAGREAILDRSNRILVDLAVGALASADQPRLMGGANLAAVETGEGRWEVLQFRDADEVSPGRFRLGVLVRGRAGSGGAAAAVGARFVLLDERCVPLPLAESETGAALDWLVVPAGRPLDDGAALRESYALGRQTRLPLAPAHLRARRDAAGLAIRWIRRSRATLDPFDDEIALDEDAERYRVRIEAGNGREIVRDTQAPSLAVTREEIAAAFGAEAPGVLRVSVAQMGATVGPGGWRTVEVGAA
ncbi:baseplate multidomain protein megatron [Aureimonas jatrophae]|uniref:Putative phage tail protein n=1 Tax=Aureimonas jatrophae TaxID=1166073 RepID=A0A1H0CQL4_9HYPH|nr:glycoside hydrolase/phage tail family protein [Aureimonas jatrophae]MBB3949339.1 hypothetical protein [Aureimonas jatrophae]SDN60126.1 Putative phage tail protein [Aureimonas jatrophae]